MMQEALGVIGAPLMGSLIAGFFGKTIGRRGAHWVTIVGVFIALLLSCHIGYTVFSEHLAWEQIVYEWAKVGDTIFQIGFLIDPLTVLMMVVVTFVSLMVHIYTIGYMAEDEGYQRFFSYISLFTFAMLMLVMSNNFLQLFFGWEAVGVVSYLLIGFWYKKETAIVANLKAFLINRVGDFGFLLGIAAVYQLFHTFNYSDVFASVGAVVDQGTSVTWLCLALFVGAMGKSAQIPLHSWLPDSMEGPTPISALIHAATMVTAGVFMVARLSPVFEYSETALNVILCIGATTCFFMGLLGLVQHDIKRVIAYSTLSQLGYMVAALGASAYAASLFHLMTHAFFKALLFLGAGAVIIALHHEQDMRHMGGLRRYLPITYFMMLIGTLALIGFPGFSGFYSKDLIIEAVSHTLLPGRGYAYPLLLVSVLVTSLYSFRLLFMVFHGDNRNSHAVDHPVHEVPVVVWGPLVALAIPSVIAGIVAIEPALHQGLGNALFVLPEHDVLAAIAEHALTPFQTLLHGFTQMPFLLALSGFVLAWLLYGRRSNLPQLLQLKCRWVYAILVQKYGFDLLNQKVIVPMVRAFGWICWQAGDRFVIEGAAISGSLRGISGIASLLRRLHSGYLYHAAFAMTFGVLGAVCWLSFPW